MPSKTHLDIVCEDVIKEISGGTDPEKLTNAQLLEVVKAMILVLPDYDPKKISQDLAQQSRNRRSALGL